MKDSSSSGWRRQEQERNGLFVRVGRLVRTHTVTVQIGDERLASVLKATHVKPF